MTLDEAITACKGSGVLSDKTAELSIVIRRYRNLIHPGRLLRLSESADVNSATVCEALVRMINGEVASSKRQTYGYTAEQIASKIERDSSSVAILTHLLKKTNERELERLLLEVLPERYLALEAESQFDNNLSSIEKTFQLAFEAAPDCTKEKTAKRFVKILHEEDGERVLSYERVFFRANQLDYLQDEERKAVKLHLAAQLKDNPTKELFEASLGIGKFLEPSDVAPFVDAAVRPVLDPTKKRWHSTCETYIRDLYVKLPAGPDQLVNERLESWVRFLKQKNRDDDASRLQALISDDVPF